MKNPMSTEEKTKPYIIIEVPKLEEARIEDQVMTNNIKNNVRDFKAIQEIMAPRSQTVNQPPGVVKDDDIGLAEEQISRGF